MDITNNKEQMQFEYREGSELASLTYRFYKDKNIAFMHTTVPESMKGKGVGSALAQYAFAYARQVDKMVMVYCSFVAGYLKKHPELRNQLNPEFYH